MQANQMLVTKLSLPTKCWTTKLSLDHCPIRFVLGLDFYFRSNRPTKCWTTVHSSNHYQVLYLRSHFSNKILIFWSQIPPPAFFGKLSSHQRPNVARLFVFLSYKSGFSHPKIFTFFEVVKVGSLFWWKNFCEVGQNA